MTVYSLIKLFNENDRPNFIIKHLDNNDENVPDLFLSVKEMVFVDKNKIILYVENNGELPSNQITLWDIMLVEHNKNICYTAWHYYHDNEPVKGIHIRNDKYLAIENYHDDV